MFSSILNIAKYVLGNFNTTEADINEIYDKLKLANNDEKEELKYDELICDSKNAEGCFYKYGTITHMFDNSVIIDDRYICDSENITCNNLNVGSKVYYMAYQKDENTDPKVRKIISIVDNCDDGNNENLKNHVIKNQMLKKRIVVKVMKRNGRIVYCQPSDITFNLDKIQSTFVPYVGDWLKLESLVEFDEESDDLSGQILEVEKILPLRLKLKIGLVTKYDVQTGVGSVEKDTIFVKSSCESGYFPCIGDKVICDSIESDQGIYSWRCLSVVPLQQVSNDDRTIPLDITNEPKKNKEEDLKKLFQDKQGITISDNIIFNVNPGENRVLQVEIKNCSDITHTLKKCVFMSAKAMSQLSLVSPDVNTMTLLKPAETLIYTFKSNPKFVGSTEELVIFCFNNFTIGRNFKIIVNSIDSTATTNFLNTNGSYNNNKLARQDNYDQLSYIPGIRPCKPPKFIAVRSGVFRIPQKIWDIMLPCINNKFSQIETEGIITDAFPSLNDDLTLNNYRDRFHTLLYLEEISLTIDMQKYDMDSASMIHSGEYLVLEVPGLVEKRPSLIVGDRAIVSFKWDTSAGNMKNEGFIHKIKSSQVYLKFHSSFHCNYSGEDCQVTFKSSYSTIGRCHNAINLAILNLGSEILFPTSINEKEPQINLEENNSNEKLQYKFTNSKSILSTSISTNSNYNFENSSLTKSPENKYANLASVLPKIIIQKKNTVMDSTDFYISQMKKRKLIWFNEKLNYYQKEAVRNILCGVARPLPYVIFGPPGTGKTITLCETILQILTTIPDSRLLIATPSNSSANLIAERLLDSDALKPGDLVRLIARHCIDDGSIPEKLLPYCAIGNLAAEHSTRDYYCSTEGTRFNCTMSVLGRHRLTIGTCMALGILHNMGFPRGHFTHIIVDEAGQATEPEIMVPLTFNHSNCGQIILAGDPMQLGPVVNSQFANYFGLSESFLVRLLQQFPYQRDNESFQMGYDPRVITKLVINYRSLPEILELPNSLFYDSELQSYVSAETSSEIEFLRSIVMDLPARDGEPPAMIFHGVNGENCQDPDSPSWYNPAEATQVYLYLLKLYGHGVTENDIGIITPYKKQVAQIRALLTELDMQLPKVGSVEEFQGQERKVIILSTVRSMSNYIDNDMKHALGFVASPRRLNVAITRARALLVIIGNPNLLSQDPYWRSVLNYCLKNKSYTGCDHSSINMINNCDEINKIINNFIV